VTDEHWPLVKAWLIAALRPVGPFPILKTVGEQGSAKSTMARVLRALTDPNTCPTRGAPGGERDLMVAAESAWVCCFDNLSYVSPELSDALCRLCTGGGFGVRTHYENAEETVFSAKRPIILNGIEDPATRSDLMDRAIIVELPRLADRDRLPERVFDERFEKARPKIFGALLDALAAALKNLPDVERSDRQWPRMADFAMWATAAEPALGLKEGDFLKAYAANRKLANETALEASPVAAALLALRDKPAITLRGQIAVKAPLPFDGTATELLKLLSAGQDTRAKSWPKNAKALSGILERLAPNLRAAGLSVEKGRRGNDKVWRIAYARTQSPQGSEPKGPPGYRRPPPGPRVPPAGG
jgi:hypothetical protein